MTRTIMKETKNKQICPVSFCLSKIAGKWKPLIIFNLTKNNNRFGLLLKAIPVISKNILTRQLRELEDDKLIIRTIFPEVPPRVEYELSELGASLLPIIGEMAKWGKAHSK